MLFSLLAYLGCGAVAGILAGLLGVGGGLVLVPMMLAIFPTVGVPPQYVQQMALGTSLASIMITSISSARAHNKRGAVHWDIFKAITPGILVGTFGGGLLDITTGALRLTLDGAVAYYETQPPRGEYVLIVEGAPKQQESGPVSEEEALMRVQALLAEGLSRKDAVRQVAAETGLAKNQLYDAALRAQHTETE